MIGSRDHSPCWMLRLKCGGWQKLAAYTPDPSMMSQRKQMVIQRYESQTIAQNVDIGHSKLIRSGHWLASSSELSRNIWPREHTVN
jgi:hypothetical protein